MSDKLLLMYMSFDRKDTPYLFVLLLLFSGGSRISHWGGADPLGGPNLRRIHFLAKTYVKMKEIDPVGGRAPAAPPGSANAIN